MPSSAGLFAHVARAASTVSVFKTASSSAVAPGNTPGSRIQDESPHSVAARAMEAVQSALRNESCSDGVVGHRSETFARIRLHFGRSDNHYRRSLAQSQHRLINADQAAGKSSAFFIFTPDGRYCVKAIDPSEARTLLWMLDDYEAYVASHPLTLLPRLYDLFEVRLQEQGSVVWLLVMGNALGGRNECSLRFDLKGSTHGRVASAKERSKGTGAVLKDLDFVNFGCALRGADAEADAFLGACSEAIKWDVAFLSDHELLDYSLLIGIARVPNGTPRAALSHVRRVKLAPDSLGMCLAWVLRSDGEELSDCPLEPTQKSGGPNCASQRDEHLVAYLSIIDIFMRYTPLKRLENFILDPIVSGDISCKPPPVYAQRFVQFTNAALGGDNATLRANTEHRLAASRRPLGILLQGEYGRKDIPRSLWTRVGSVLGIIAIFALCARRLQLHNLVLLKHF